MLIKADMYAAGGGDKFVTQSETVTGTQDITINGISKIKQVACQYDTYNIAYAYEEDGAYQMIASGANFIKINSVSGNTINLTVHLSPTVTFYVAGE